MRKLIVFLVLLLPAAMLFAGGEQEPAPTQPDVSDDVPAAPGTTDFESKWRDPEMPEAWFSEPQKASELGITEFNQAPMLDERVANGELPPVAERLPDDPPVIVPYAEVGQYGGTMTMFGVDFEREFSFYTGGGAGLEGLNQASPDGQGYFPWIADEIRFLENDTVVEVTFRRGLKWSDGTEFFPGREYDFYWNEVLDKELNDPSLFTPALLNIEGVDDYTVRWTFGAPNPVFGYTLNHAWVHDLISNSQPMAPMHIMRQHMPEYVGEEEAQRKAEELGFSEVDQFLSELAQQTREQDDPRFNMPTMQAYVVVSRTESEVVLERNPYYPFVDTEGNQLPYIDRIITRFAAQRENIELQAISGAADVATETLTSRNIPVYLQNEEEGDYTTYIYLDAALNKPFYSFNFTPPEEAAAYTPYYRNADFRKALSLAINRQQINERFYFGQAIPMQVTIAPMSDLFRPEFGNAYADFDPDRARAMLDQIGLIDQDGDGFRDFPDGSEFRLSMMYANASYLSDISIHEYVVSNWNDVGIAVDIQTVNEGVFWERSPALQWELKPHLVDGSIPYPLGLVRLAISPVEIPEVDPFGDWSTYFISGGDQGTRPPDDLFPEIERIYNAANTYLQTLDDEHLLTLLESQAENIWVIGTVGFTPVPIIVANRIHNVPELALWDEAIGRERILYPMQWYINED